MVADGITLSSMNPITHPAPVRVGLERFQVTSHEFTKAIPYIYYHCNDRFYRRGDNSKATGCALEPSATKDRGCAANHGSHNPSDYRGWSENTFKSYDTNP